MTEMAVGAWNRLQDRVIDWRETRAGKNDLREQHADIRRSRMTCSATLEQVQDWTGGIAAFPAGRRRVVEEREAKPRAISGKGIRWNLAVIALALVSAIFGAILLADLAGMGTGSRNITRLNGKIEAVESRNAQLQEQIALSGNSASIRTEAVKLDLISSAGARTVRLEVPQRSQITVSSATTAAENAETEGRMLSLGGD